MKRTAILAAGLLASCHASHTVTAENASVNQVADQVKTVAAAGGMPSPGHWQANMTVTRMDIPDVPAAMADRMKVALGKSHVIDSCLTKQEAEKPKGDFFGAMDKSCRYDHFTMGGGKIDAKMTCAMQGGQQVMVMNGRYGADSYAMTVSTDLTGTGPMGKMSSTTTIDAHRTGACTGTEDNLKNGG